jgi:hypothetical protein
MSPEQLYGFVVTVPSFNKPTAVHTIIDIAVPAPASHHTPAERLVAWRWAASVMARAALSLHKELEDGEDLCATDPDEETCGHHSDADVTPVGWEEDPTPAESVRRLLDGTGPWFRIAVPTDAVDGYLARAEDILAAVVAFDSEPAPPEPPVAPTHHGDSLPTERPSIRGAEPR